MSLCPLFLPVALSLINLIISTVDRKYGLNIFHSTAPPAPSVSFKEVISPPSFLRLVSSFTASKRNSHITQLLPQPPIHPTRIFTMSTKAFVQKPAPLFTATTVFEHGEFKEVSLSDYQGQW